jgi:hypothetical protein
MSVPQPHRCHLLSHHQGGVVLQAVVAVLEEPTDSQNGKTTMSWLLLRIPFRLLLICNNSCLLIALEIGNTRGKNSRKGSFRHCFELMDETRKYQQKSADVHKVSSHLRPSTI